MNAIFKSGNVYVLSPLGNVRNDVNIEEIQELICGNSPKKSRANLYGGRVGLYYRSYSMCIEMKVDGLLIEEISFSSAGVCNLCSEMDIHRAVAYLNQIENLGVDTFIENYKAQLQALKEEIEASAVKLEQELSVQQDEEKSSLLKNLRSSIRSISCLIFMLLINLNAGLENHDYTEAYETILNLYF